MHWQRFADLKHVGLSLLMQGNYFGSTGTETLPILYLGIILYANRLVLVCGKYRLERANRNKDSFFTRKLPWRCCTQYYIVFKPRKSQLQFVCMDRSNSAFVPCLFTSDLVNKRARSETEQFYV